MHGGRVSAGNADDGGAVFAVVLPKAPNADADATPPPA
jgi:signal transduction histidine kinase